MALTLSEQSLDWALEHILNHGDTDIFPEAFEFDAIRNDWQDVKAWIRSVDILKWTVRPYRRCLAPKHRFGFRISTQLDPLDILVYTALVHEVGAIAQDRGGLRVQQPKCSRLAYQCRSQ